MINQTHIHTRLEQSLKKYTKRHTKNSINKTLWDPKICERNSWEGKKKEKEETKNKEMVYLISNISIVTLNVNDLNISIKRQRLAEWVKRTGCLRRWSKL